MGEFYITAGKSVSAEFIEKHSRFIGYVKPVATEAEAVGFINEKRKTHYDARHNVYAYSLKNGQIKRYSDDGEPQGTAGVPVLEVINKNSLVDAVVVVTRYFGGILLGTGGLVRAYSHTAALAIEAAGIVRMEKCFYCRIISGYDRYGKLSGLISECGGVLDNTEFLENAVLYFHIPTDLLGFFNKKLADATNGQITADIVEENFFKI